jgi:hypothetical protein
MAQATTGMNQANVDKATIATCNRSLENACGIENRPSTYRGRGDTQLTGWTYKKKQE